ncbi:hypothetical protein A4X13_0g7848 [Tilletia indica]|uniref:Uncharacterized protein n=1 Tax=Tilletia indica TaxID=43049 RepID=A0A177TTG9_9BASI|nr:hypothetical protein A4X13_0g7848 [Tilletia indica]
MALIIVSGLPCSGRSSISSSLRANFEQRISSPTPSSSSVTPTTAQPRRVHTVSDDTVHTPRSAYSAQVLEKPARASYLSAVSRAFGRDVVVLADGGAGLNIKGFRYQLWCAAREQGVRCVTLHVYASPEECKRRNAARRAAGEEAYDDETIEDMLKRYEEPNAMTRWDSPLFLVKSESPIADASSATAEADPEKDGDVGIDVDPDAGIPYDEIWKAATEAAPRKAPAVVVPHRQTTSNYLSALESVSQSIINTVLALSSNSLSSLPIPLPSTPSHKLSLTLPASAVERPPTLSALQRLRRQFVKMHSTGLASGSEIASARDADTRALRTGANQGKGGEGKEGLSVAGSVTAPAGSTIEDDIARKFVGWLEQSL